MEFVMVSGVPLLTQRLYDVGRRTPQHNKKRDYNYKT